MFVRDEAIQHTMCRIAITALTVTFQTFKMSGTGEIFDCINNIIHYTDICRNELVGRRTSAAAERKIKSTSTILKRQLSNRSSTEAGERFYAMIVASTLLVCDCHNVAPLWFKGDNWKELHKATDRLFDLISNEKAHEDGTDLYMRLSY